MERVVEPLANISASDLLNLIPACFGWVRKGDNMSSGIKSMVKPLVDFAGWPWYYMILRTGCLYVFKKPESSNFHEAIPLSSYRVCDALEISKYQWVFKLVHLTEIKTIFFAVDTEFDLKKWKDAIIKDKDSFCGSHYTEIEEGNQTPQKPLPPLPPPTEKARPRPPAPPPSRYGSAPRPLPHPASQPLPQREGQRESSPHIFPKPKPPASLPRPVPVLPEMASSGRIPPRREMHRSISDKNLAGKPGYDNVVQQFKGSALSFIHEGMAHPGKSRTLNSARHPPDGCELQGELQNEERQVTRGAGTTFIPNAYSSDMTKEAATRVLKAEQPGTYLTRPSAESESGRSLSVRDKNADSATPLVRHYRIFYNESLGYAINTKGPRFASIPKTLEHYHRNELPNTKQKLRQAYIPRL